MGGIETIRELHTLTVIGHIAAPYKTHTTIFYIRLITLLQGLTQVEEMLVSAVMPIMSIYRLPHGQYGYTGHVINLPQDVMSFAHRLPRLPSDLVIVVVRKA